MPVIMAEILVSVPGCIGFGGVIALATAAGWYVSGEDGRADLEMKNDVAFEAKCASVRLSRDPQPKFNLGVTTGKRLPRSIIASVAS